ncbi:MAG: hypothetical protein KJZ85_09800 [Rhodobacteraceae bacterium]|jgi:hypothetical protein|nr:hypothetical protein [Paracoccaceae bacterium]
MRILSAAPLALAIALACALPAAAQEGGGGISDAVKRLGDRLAGAAAPDFGDDTGRYPNDGECDDRRFVGQGMAQSFSWKEAGRDASDCRHLHSRGLLRLWVLDEARAATDCSRLDFGNDVGEYVNDGECDDPRFEGVGVASGLTRDNVGQDATDCRRLCGWGMIFLRDY